MQAAFRLTVPGRKASGMPRACDRVTPGLPGRLRDEYPEDAGDARHPRLPAHLLALEPGRAAPAVHASVVAAGVREHSAERPGGKPVKPPQFTSRQIRGNSQQVFPPQLGPFPPAVSTMNGIPPCRVERSGLTILQKVVD